MIIMTDVQTSIKTRSALLLGVDIGISGATSEISGSSDRCHQPSKRAVSIVAYTTRMVDPFLGNAIASETAS
jgi:hypothetical protein